MSARALQEQALATIHGRVIDPAGTPIRSGTVRLSTDLSSSAVPRVYEYQFTVESDGTFRASGIAPNDYVVELFNAKGESIDSLGRIQLAANRDQALDFDLTSQRYLDSLSPADRQALEAAKQRNLQLVAKNQQIAEANKMLLEALSQSHRGNFDEAIATLRPAFDSLPDEPLIWAALGEIQVARADAAAAQAKTSGRTPASMPAVVQQYAEAEASYRKALSLIAAQAKPSPNLEGSCWTNIGQSLAGVGKLKEAADAYRHARDADPASAARSDYNLAATLFNAGDLEGAVAAADELLLLTPDNANAHYIKASSLIPKATYDQKTKKFILPAGCLEAYRSYLALAPDGTHAKDVRDLLASLGQPSVARPFPSSPPSHPAAMNAAIVAAAPAPFSTRPTAPATRGSKAEPPPAAAESSVPIPHNYALIIATDNYDHWPKLANPVHDGDAINETLTSLFGFEVEELRNPTAEQVLVKLNAYLHKPFRVQDQLLIMFSGHGYFDPDLGKGFIVPSEAQQPPADIGHRTLLAHETIMSYVNRIPAQHVVLVLDACFAGTLDRKIADGGLRGDPSDFYARASLPELLLRKETKRTRRYFASGGKDYVPDGLPGHHSPFTSALLVALNQAADRKGYATLDDLQSGLETVNPEPRWGDIEGDNEPGADFLLLTPAAIRKLEAPGP